VEGAKLGKRGHTCENCGYWTPFMRSWFPSSILTDTETAEPLDVKEWDEELYQALTTSDCVEFNGLIYTWNKRHDVVKRNPIALFGMKNSIHWDKPKHLAERYDFLKMAARRSSDLKKQTVLI
jgi:hypothetical protein